MFEIIGSKGFHITFKNGVTVSVQFGPGNYCDNKDAWDGYDMQNSRPKGDIHCNNAEVAIFKKGGEWLMPKCADDVVVGWRNADELFSLLKWAKEY